MTLRKKPFKNIVRKGENAANQHFLLFPQCFLPIPEQISFFHPYLFCRLQALSIWTSLEFCFLINPFPNKPWFLRVCSTSFLKTLWEKEKLLATSNFSFSHSVFYTLRKLSAILIKFEIVVCKLFQFGRV